MNIPKGDELLSTELVEVIEKYNCIIDIIQSTTSHKGVVLSIILQTTLSDFIETIKEQLTEDYYIGVYNIAQTLKQKYIDKGEEK